MILFVDTSAILKAFQKELGTDQVIELLNDTKNDIVISELTKIEYKSALFRRFRNGEISEGDVNELLDNFEDYIQTVEIIEVNSLTIKTAEYLLNKHGLTGLRTLDAIQFASFELVETDDKTFVSADLRFCTIVINAGYKVIEIK